MRRTSPAILLIGLLVLRAVFGLAGGAMVWCDFGHHEHDSLCSHVHPGDCDQGLALLPVPADFHDLGCECEVEKEIGGDAFTVPVRTAEYDFPAGTPVATWTCSAEWDVRIASFHGPPRLGFEPDHALQGRLVVVESTRLNI